MTPDDTVMLDESQQQTLPSLPCLRVGSGFQGAPRPHRAVDARQVLDCGSPLPLCLFISAFSLQCKAPQGHPMKSWADLPPESGTITPGAPGCILPKMGVMKCADCTTDHGWKGRVYYQARNERLGHQRDTFGGPGWHVHCHRMIQSTCLCCARAGAQNSIIIRK
jgi:hypothetical protein